MTARFIKSLYPCLLGAVLGSAQAQTVSFSEAWSRVIRQDDGLAAEQAGVERAQQLRDYLNAFEQQAQLGGELTEEQRAFLAWGRAKADWLDPLVGAADELLDQEIEIPSPYGYRRW